MTNNVQDAVQRQFGQVAANYSTSTVHAKGEDLPKMVEAVHLNGNERVLDAGCGTGHTALTFAPHVKEVIAADITVTMLEQVEILAKARNITNIVTQRADVEKLPFEDASFDLVTSRLSAHHWPHPQRALSEFMRVLKPGGSFILSDVISPEDPTEDTFLQAMELLRDPSHVRDHSSSQWQEMLRSAGFASEVYYTWDMSIDFDAWVMRMATPHANIAMIKTLFDGAPQQVRTVMKVQPDYSFIFKGALFRARR